MSGVSFVVCESEMRTFAGRRFDVDWFALRLRLPLVLRGTCALLSIPRSRLERECRSPLEPFGMFAIFLSPHRPPGCLVAQCPKFGICSVGVFRAALELRRFAQRWGSQSLGMGGVLCEVR